MKILFFLLLTLFFATIGFAEVPQQSDETNKKIEKIEEKLDTTKEDLTKYTQITEDTKERVGDINGSVDRFTTALTVFGSLVTIGLIFVAWSSRNSAIQEARITSQDEAQKLLDKWVKEKEKHFEKIMNDKIRLFEDNVDVKTIQIMYENAVGYDISEKYDEALKIYDEIIRSYAKSQNETILLKVTMAMLNKGVVLHKKDKHEEATKTYNELIATYKNSEKDEVIENIAIAMCNKGISCSVRDKFDEAIITYNELISNYRDSKIDEVIVQVAKALLNKGFILGKKNMKEAIETYDELISTYQDSKIDDVIEKVIAAIQNKFEIEMILDMSISYDKLLIEKLSQMPKDMAIIDMLLILQNAKTSLQDIVLESWLEKYKEVKHSWGFDELIGWIEKATYSEEVKQRIGSYIETFKTHLHRV